MVCRKEFANVACVEDIDGILWIVSAPRLYALLDDKRLLFLMPVRPNDSRNRLVKRLLLPMLDHDISGRGVRET